MSLGICLFISQLPQNLSSQMKDDTSVTMKILKHDFAIFNCNELSSIFWMSVNFSN